jgi:hypothetical protein
VAEYVDAAFVWEQERRHHADERAFAAAVGAEDAERLADLDLEGHVADGHRRPFAVGAAEALGHLMTADCVHELNLSLVFVNKA